LAEAAAPFAPSVPILAGVVIVRANDLQRGERVVYRKSARYRAVCF